MTFSIGTMMQNSLKDIENVIFPQICRYCDTNLKQKEIYICYECISNVPHTEMGDWRNIVTSSEHIDFAISAFWYDDLLNDCVHKSKYNGYQKLLRIISKYAAEIIQNDLIPLNIDLLFQCRCIPLGNGNAVLIKPKLSVNHFPIIIKFRLIPKY